MCTKNKIDYAADDNALDLMMHLHVVMAKVPAPKKGTKRARD